MYMRVYINVEKGRVYTSDFCTLTEKLALYRNIHIHFNTHTQ